MAGFWDGTPDMGQGGSNITIHCTDPNEAGQTITIEVDRSDNVDAPDIDVDLDGEGKGSHVYSVPTGPASIEFTTEGHASHVLTVT